MNVNSKDWGLESLEIPSVGEGTMATRITAGTF